MMFEVPWTLMQKALLALELVDVHTAVWLPLNQLRAEEEEEGEDGEEEEER